MMFRENVNPVSIILILMGQSWWLHRHFFYNTVKPVLSKRQAVMVKKQNQSRTNGPINAQLTIAQVMPRYKHNNEKQEA